MRKDIDIESQIWADKLCGCYLDANAADRLDIDQAIIERATKDGKGQYGHKLVQLLQEFAAEKRL